MKISADADGGPRSRVSALHSAPDRRQQKFFGARVCIVTFKHLPQPIRMHMQSFRTLQQLLAITPHPLLYHSAGVGAKFVGIWNINIYVA